MINSDSCIQCQMGRGPYVILNEPTAVAGAEPAIRNPSAQQRDVSTRRRTTGKKILEVIEQNFAPREGVKIEINVVAPELPPHAKRMTSCDVGQHVLRLPSLGY